MIRSSFTKPGELEQDFELNLASIIDCFVVLIAFVLISTSFFSISILDAVVAGESAQAAANSDETVVIELKSDRSILVKRSEGGTVAFRIAARGADRNWDFDGLAQGLAGLKAKKTDLNSAIISADNSVSYRDVMASMEIAKTQVERVNLGGF